jgi:hypothetical protein
MFWILVKGSELMKDRIKDATSSTVFGRDHFKTGGKAFASTLETHLILCDWAGEGWRWYINFMEKTFEDLTRSSLAIRVTKAPSMQAPHDVDEPKPIRSKRKRTFSWKKGFHVASPSPLLDTTLFPDIEQQRIQLQQLDPSPLGGPPPPPPPPINIEGTPYQEGQLPSYGPEFSLHDLQDVQSTEDKINEAIQVLSSNANILGGLKEFYESTMENPDLPQEIATACGRDVAKFSKRVTSVINDLHMHKSQAETLLRLLADRKMLLYGILDYRAVEANLLLAKRAQVSAERMEEMTKEMSHIAQKTKQETVSMKIITLVTLFFLPGTFLSASTFCRMVLSSVQYACAC